MTPPRPKPTFSVVAPCPCGSGRRDAHCCLPILRGEPAPTAEALMRSRYTAYVRHRGRWVYVDAEPDSLPRRHEAS